MEEYSNAERYMCKVSLDFVHTSQNSRDLDVSAAFSYLHQ